MKNGKTGGFGAGVMLGGLRQKRMTYMTQRGSMSYGAERQSSYNIQVGA